MCYDSSRDRDWEEYENEGGRMSRDEWEHEQDIKDYGMDESLNDDWD